MKTQRIRVKTQLGETGEKDPNDWATQHPGQLKKMVEREAGTAHRKQADHDDPFAWTGNFKMTDAEIAELADPEWIYCNLIIAGHLIVIVAEPNAGKTTIMEWVCSRISDSYRVIYVNADISGGDAKSAHKAAKVGGYELLLPDMKVGLSMDDVVSFLTSMNESAADLSEVMMVFDTLKKMVDVISKRAARKLYKTLRGLSTKGMTIILLAHTNKHKGDDGKPIFEGTGDLRSDVDEMIYLIPLKHEDKSMTVSTEPDKVRGQFDPITFEITPNRKVRQTDFVDVAKERQYEIQREADSEDIDIIDRLLRAGAKNQSEIVAHCHGEMLSRPRVLKLLKRYTKGEGAIWNCRRSTENNAAVYSRNTVPAYLKK